ncbi:MAG: cyclic nucleotide-binding domain-containing protein [Erysipelothrix sp.]
MKTVKLDQHHHNILEYYNLNHLSKEFIHAVHFSPKELVVEETYSLSQLYIIVTGRARVYRSTQDGQSHFLWNYIYDGIIGEVELMNGSHTIESSVVAITEFECIAIPYDICINEIKTNHQFLLTISESLAQKVRDNADNLVSLAFNTGVQRLCRYILNNSDNDYFTDTLTEVSKLVALSYRHVLRILTQLCDDHILIKQKSGYQIMNRKSLITLSGY